jgi:hypothetical protein
MRAKQSEIELFSVNTRKESELLGFQPGQLPRSPFLDTFRFVDNTPRITQPVVSRGTSGQYFVDEGGTFTFHSSSCALLGAQISPIVAIFAASSKKVPTNDSFLPPLTPI